MIGNFDYRPWLWLLLSIACSLAIGFILSRLTLKAIVSLVSKKEKDLFRKLSLLSGIPLQLFISILILDLFPAHLYLPPPDLSLLKDAKKVLLIGIAGWFFIRALEVAGELIERKLTRDVTNGLKISSVRTQVSVFTRIATIVAGFLTFSLILIQFDVVKNVGVSLLASAGFVSVVVGLAAQRTISTLFAGIQISLTQPIRIGDVIFIENESGVVEEITLSYVVIRMGDLKSLIVPISNFINQSFQNWTKTSTELYGSVDFFLSQKIPIAKLREEASSIVKRNKNWNGKRCDLIVQEFLEKAVRVRLVASANTPQEISQLKNEIREEMLLFLQTLNNGGYLLS